MNKKNRQSIWPFFFLAPTLILFGIFLFLPVVIAFLLAFKEITILRFHGFTDLVQFVTTNYVGWRNFSDAIHNPAFFTALKNTLIYTAATVPLSVGISLTLALIMTPLNERLKRFFIAAYYLPGIFSVVVLSMVWRWIYEPESGLINLLLGTLGVQGPDWLGNPHIALGSIILAGVIYAPGLGILLYTASIEQIPSEMQDAARMDGTSTFQQWIHVIIPLLKPTTLFLLVINTIWSFQVFTSIYIMTRGGPGDSTTTLVYYIYDLAFVQAGRKGEAAAVSLILFALVALFAGFQFRVLRTDIEY